MRNWTSLNDFEFGKESQQIQKTKELKSQIGGVFVMFRRLTSG